ncbi:MAG: dihydropteroate synthase [bacterium]|nr:dihydropteroate synthase [bacterium]
MLKKTLIMGILNVTPDSFSDGGMYYNNAEKSVKRIQQMLKEGADIIDIGGMSTRPGAKIVLVTEELQRTIPVIELARKKLGNNFEISIDTYRAEVAEAALEKGANIVNSLGGFKFDNNLALVIKKFNCKIVIYHIQGLPKTMQLETIKYKNVINDIIAFFNKQIVFAVENKITKDNLILDPGIGFGKTVEQNLIIIKKFYKFKKLHLPIMIGVSRKSHIGLLLKDKLQLSEVPSFDNRLEGSLAETAIAVINGAQIIRTHDVHQTHMFLTVLDELMKI